MQPIGFEEKKYHPNAARSSKFEEVGLQTTQLKSGVGMRLSKSADKLLQALIDLFQFDVVSMFGPAFLA